MRILIADDEPAVVRVLERHLVSWGYEPVTAGNGAEAWRLLKSGDSPAIAIIDWDMPGLSGIEVCRLVRSKPQGEATYVLMLTGRQDKADLIEALEAGVDDFLSKPFHARELQLRLAKGVSLREGRLGRHHDDGAPPTGVILGTKYRLERKLGEGGMATVWIGVHLSLGINVAIKFMKTELLDDADFASFESEARAAAQLRSEHIVRIFDHGITNEGLPYLVMEFLSGEPLASRIAHTGALAPAATCNVVDQIAHALSEAHGRGLVHRDVKPDNIILVRDPERPAGFVAKLIDFGLARAVSTELPAPGAVVAGTPSYMSPEHIFGRAPPSPALDLWALATTAFAAMTGRVPFDHETLWSLIKAVANDPLPMPSTYARVPPAVDDWFRRACARDPEARFQTAVELASALRRAVGSPAHAPSESTAPLSVSVTTTEPLVRAGLTLDSQPRPASGGQEAVSADDRNADGVS